MITKKKIVTVVVLISVCGSFFTLSPSSVSAFSEQRKFIGQEYDAITGLDYLNARYYDAKRGQFINQDPVFQALGDESQIKALTGKTQEEILMNPQSLNSYSYANNNPVVNSDPSGRSSTDVAQFAQSMGPYGVPLIAAVGAYSAAVIVYENRGAIDHAFSNIRGYFKQGRQDTQGLENSLPLTSYLDTNGYRGSIYYSKKDVDKYGSLPTVEELRGKSPGEIGKILEEKNKLPKEGESSRGGGTRWPVPGRNGDQVRIELGNPKDPDPVKQGPYGRVSQDGKKSNPFPIKGNPLLKQ